MDAVSRLGLANLIDREVGEMIPVVIGIDPGTPEGDRSATVETRRGELGCVDRFVIHETPRPRVELTPRTVSDGMPEQGKVNPATVRRRRQLRTEHEARLALALQQPQGLGLLFAGLRPKSER